MKHSYKVLLWYVLTVIMPLVATVTSSMLMAQQPVRTVKLTWEDSLNPPGTTYSVYRASGQCSSSNLTWTKIGDSLQTKTLDDQATPGAYCYHVTASHSGMESDPSDPAVAQVKPFKPRTLDAAVQ